MAVGKCEQCGADEYMPFVCKFCRGRYCAAHRLPENHGCNGLESYRERLRSEGRLVAPEPGVMTPLMSPTARVGASVGGLLHRLNGKAAYTFLGVMVAVFVVQFALTVSGLAALHNALFVLGPHFYLAPWTLVTSVFAHGGFRHLFVNGIMLFFFGPTLERLIGTRRFSYLFIGGGALAGLLQVVVFSSLTGAASGVLGASGGILALLGTLAILAPRLTVLVFFVIPAPLWLITAFYALADVLGLFNRGSTVAHLAHLGGLALGLAYGKHLHNRGLRAHVPRQPSVYRKYF